MMKTEKRKANVGERILIMDAIPLRGEYKNGAIGIVSEKKAKMSGLLYVNGWESPVHIDEYEVIVAETKPAPKKSTRITVLETEVAELKAKVSALEKAVKYPLTARFDAEINANADEILADIKRKATSQSPNEQRADVIKRAKAFVADAINRNYSRKSIWFVYSGMFVKSHEVRFIVNAEKRTVVALIQTIYGDVQVKDVAKCDPSDVFNADIGKAIALGRALGVDVTEFTKAVQPTEVVVGMRAEINGTFEPYVSTLVKDGVAINPFTNNVGFIRNNPRYLKCILDDTDAVYE